MDTIELMVWLVREAGFGLAVYAVVGMTLAYLVHR